MPALAWLRIGSDEPVPLVPGDYVGRSPRARLQAGDPHVSEAHALVSLRGGSLRLLALRGRLRLGSAFVNEVELRPGVCVELAPGVTATCEGVQLPPRVMAIDVEGLGEVPLTGTTSIQRGPPPRVVSGVVDGAIAVLWRKGHQWFARDERGKDRAWFDGFVLMDSNPRIVATEVPTSGAGCTMTVPVSGPVRRLRRLGNDVVVRDPEAGVETPIGGVPGRILAAVLASTDPLHWTDCCAQVWPGDRADAASLRNRLDVGLARLRARLRELETSQIAVAFDGEGHLRAMVPDAMIDA